MSLDLGFFTSFRLGNSNYFA